MSDQQSDLVILGGGSGGYACALRASELGLSVTLIEEAELGGTCLHRGCIPTKALLHSAEVADTARESATFGVNTTLDGIDMPAVLKYKDSVVARLYKGLQGLVKARKVNFVQGTGTLIDRALTFEPENGAFLDSKGWLLYKKADFPKSRTFIEKAVSFPLNINVEVTQTYTTPIDTAAALEELTTGAIKGLEGMEPFGRGNWLSASVRNGASSPPS